MQHNACNNVGKRTLTSPPIRIDPSWVKKKVTFPCCPGSTAGDSLQSAWDWTARFWPARIAQGGQGDGEFPNGMDNQQKSQRDYTRVN